MTESPAMRPREKARHALAGSQNLEPQEDQAQLKEKFVVVVGRTDERVVLHRRWSEGECKGA